MVHAAECDVIAKSLSFLSVKLYGEGSLLFGLCQQRPKPDKFCE